MTRLENSKKPSVITRLLYKSIQTMRLPITTKEYHLTAKGTLMKPSKALAGPQTQNQERQISTTTEGSLLGKSEISTMQLRIIRLPSKLILIISRPFTTELSAGINQVSQRKLRGIACKRLRCNHKIFLHFITWVLLGKKWEVIG